MGGVVSVTYLALSGLLVMACHLLPGRRSTLLAIMGLVWWSTLGNLSALIPGLGLMAVGFVGVYLVGRWPSLLGSLLCILISWFAWLRLYPPFSLLPHPPTMVDVGAMFLLFRLIHVLVESSSNSPHTRPPPEHLLGYLLALPTFNSGPIQRLSDYMVQVQQPPASGRWAPSLLRVGDGYVKIVILSALLLEWSQRAVPGPAGLALNLAAYTLYLYLNFSGVTDVAVGLGGMVGLTLPENFDNPLASTDFLEFWNRWHITASQWCRDYIFSPLLKIQVTHVPSRGWHPWLGVLSLFITFLLMGIWHGPGITLVLYGILLGTGAASVKTWQLLLRKMLGRDGVRSLHQSPLYLHCSRGLTFSWMSLCLACFWMDKEMFLMKWHESGLLSLATSVLLLWIGSSLLLALWHQLEPARHRLDSLMSSVQANPIGLQVGLAVRAGMVILALMFQVHPLPPQVY